MTQELQKTEEITSLPLGDIRTDEGTFQWRGSTGDTPASRDHIDGLKKILGQSKEPLDPILVYPSEATGYVVVDGHHRLWAYRKARWEHPVPVVVFRGTPEEAREAALKANNKNKLPLTKEQRQEIAWKMTKEYYLDENTRNSKELTKRLSGVSEGIVSEMRRVAKKHKEDIRNQTWPQAKLAARGLEPTLDEDWKQKKAGDLAEALRKADVHVTKYPEILAMALEMVSGDLPRALVEQWTDIAIDVAETREWEIERHEADAEAEGLPRI